MSITMSMAPHLRSARHATRHRRNTARFSGRAAAAGAFLVASLALSACSSSSSSSETTTAASASSSKGCQPPSNWRSTTATAVAGSAYAYQLTSFDGTSIRINWFPKNPGGQGAPAPTVLMGPGWGQLGDTDVTGAGIQGVLSIGQLQQGGFNVVTWDPRGFGASGGLAEVDSPAYEARDVTSMINWVARQKGVALVKPGDPRIGMVGESYGGGIQFVTAAIDCRVDAIAPTIAWNSLVTSLDKNQTPKAGWDGILSGVSTSAHLAPEILAGDADIKADRQVGAATDAYFRQRGPAQLLSRVRIPTLILQGTVDNLFTLDEGIANYETLKAQGNTVAMAWFCGGHGVCLTNPGTALDISQLSLAWMQHYVAGQTSVPVLTGFAYVDQNGTTYYAPTYPLTAGAPFVATGTGTLHLEATGGSGPPTVKPNALAANAVDSVAYGITPAPATNAVNVTVPLNRQAFVVGPPRLAITYSGTTPSADRPTRVFVQLVDPATGIVVNNQITPVPVVLDGTVHTLSLPLETISYTSHPGQSLELQLVATTVAYEVPQLGGSVNFRTIGISLPTVTNMTTTPAG